MLEACTIPIISFAFEINKEYSKRAGKNEKLHMTFEKLMNLVKTTKKDGRLT